jgi:shikimate dehydrogenase
VSHADHTKPHVLTGLIGSPIKHSASPAMHEAAAAALGWKGHYQLIDVDGADAALLRILLEGVRRMGFAGVNVTFPYKEAVVPLLDDLSDEARRIGAVNTVVVTGDQLIGHNTDATGFARAVGPIIAARPGPVVVLGTGGLGKAAAVALAGLASAELRLVDLARDKADGLARVIAADGRVGVRVFDDVAAALDGAAGLVNGTPVGMAPNLASPVPQQLLHGELWVADAVYNPLWTKLLTDAREVGALVMTGRDLAINQALDAFRLFTGAEPDCEVMSRAFDAVMEARIARKNAA